MGDVKLHRSPDCRAGSKVLTPSLLFTETLKYDLNIITSSHFHHLTGIAHEDVSNYAQLSGKGFENLPCQQVKL